MNARLDSPVIECRNITVSYGKGSARTTPLSGIALAVPAGGSVAVMGPSGSGKSTLLRVLSGAQRPNGGEVLLHGEPVGTRTSRLAGAVRLIHQDYRLVPFLNATENIRLALELSGRSDGAEETAIEALTTVGIAHLRSRMPDTLSGGEQQRVAIARAVAGRPQVLIADEPTGALDQDTSRQIGQFLRDLAGELGIAVIVATHDPLIAERMARLLRLDQGVLVP